MYGACALPKIWPRLWFSITIVNTVPPQLGGAVAAGALVSGSHVASVLPELLAAQPAKASEPSMNAPEKFFTLDKLARSGTVGKES